MTEIRTQCEGCGMCCRAIILSNFPHSMTPESMKENRTKERIVYDRPVRETMGDNTFIIQNWYPLTKEEVLQRNPQFIERSRRAYLSRYPDMLPEVIEDKIERSLNNNFYSCNQLDDATGRCMTHDNLPRICSAYPWYNGIVDEDEIFYTEDCYYKDDLKGGRRYVEQSTAESILSFINEKIDGDRREEAYPTAELIQSTRNNQSTGNDDREILGEAREQVEHDEEHMSEMREE